MQKLNDAVVLIIKRIEQLEKKTNKVIANLDINENNISKSGRVEGRNIPTPHRESYQTSSFSTTSTPITSPSPPQTQPTSLNIIANETSLDHIPDIPRELTDSTQQDLLNDILASERHQIIEDPTERKKVEEELQKKQDDVKNKILAAQQLYQKKPAEDRW